MKNDIKPKVLTLIPARKGSKRLPGKNIRNLHGKPLIAWTIEQACRCSLLDSVVVSTDCEEIAEIAKKYGAQVPFLRPQKLAADNSTSFSVVEHALQYFEQQHKIFDVVVLLEPTSPLRKMNDLDRSVQLFLDNYDNYEALVSVGKIEREHPRILKKIDANNTLLPFSSDLSDAQESYFPYGVIYLVKVDSLLKTQNFYAGRVLPYQIERWQNFEIDDEVDFACVEKIMTCYEGLL